MFIWQMLWPDVDRMRVGGDHRKIIYKPRVMAFFSSTVSVFFLFVFEWLIFAVNNIITDHHNKPL